MATSRAVGSSEETNSTTNTLVISGNIDWSIVYDDFFFTTDDILHTLQAIDAAPLLHGGQHIIVLSEKSWRLGKKLQKKITVSGGSEVFAVDSTLLTASQLRFYNKKFY